MSRLKLLGGRLAHGSWRRPVEVTDEPERTELVVSGDRRYPWSRPRWTAWLVPSPCSRTPSASTRFGARFGVCIGQTAYLARGAGVTRRHGTGITIRHLLHSVINWPGWSPAT